MKTRLSALLLLAVVSGWFGWRAFQLPDSLNPSDVGPGRIPFLLALGALALVGIIGVQTWRERVAAAPFATAHYPRPLNTILAVAALAVTAVAILVAGMYIGCALLILMILLAAGERRWWVIVPCIVGFDLFAWLCFARLLQVPLT